MSGSRWRRAADLFHAALEREPADRDAFIRGECGPDSDLYRDVLSLAAADAGAEGHALEAAVQAAAAGWPGGSAPGVLVGKRIGRYELVAHLGSGGMGDVYRARDAVLGRDVAVKVLNATLRADEGFRRRLEIEARSASSLNHPNIVTVYEIGRSDGIDFVASELIDGETLRARIGRGAMPLRDLVDVASQIAAALASAHLAGIVHRDIKPENVMIRHDGIVKVVDFGLAKVSARRPESDRMPTRAVLTATGLVAGTGCYMSPEQALGDTLDHRSDLFAFGIVLYEMATGRRPFDGPSEAAVYDALLHAAPPAPSGLAAGLTADFDAVVARALEKDRDLRYQSAADLGADLKRLRRPLSAPSLAAAPRAPRADAPWKAASLAAAAIAFVLAGALALQRRAADLPSSRFVFGPPPHTAFTLTGTMVPSVTVTVSPDGRRVAFLANESNARGRLWIRPIDSLDAAPLDDTVGATFPFWSPDSQAIAFFVGSALRVKTLAGGAARTIAVTPEGRGGTWNREGIILYGTAEGPIYRVPSAGGASTPVTTIDAAHGENWHRFPQFLPDGNHFLYLARAGDARAAFVGALDGSRRTHVLDTEIRAAYVNGHLVFVDGGALIARPFDPRRLEFTGEPMEIAPRVATSTALDASFGIAPDTLAYAARGAADSRLTWYDRTGRELGRLGVPAAHLGVRLSPDGRTAAVARSSAEQNAPDIWLLDLARGAETRFTFNKWLDISPVWSPDGATVLFSSSRTGRFLMYRRAAAGGPEEVESVKIGTSMYPEDWSPDGRSVVYSTDPPGGNSDLGLLDVATSRTRPLIASAFNEYQARISRDGKWLAYTSDESGRPEVYVRPFPAGEPRVLASVAGGSEPAWRGDGRELFYLAPGGTLMSVDIDERRGVAPGAPRTVFRAPLPATSMRFGNSYAVTPDGQRFLLTAVAGDPDPVVVTVVIGWSRRPPGSR